MLKVEIDGACVMFEVLIEKDQWWMVRFYNLAQFKYSAYVKLRKINGGSFVFTIWHNESPVRTTGTLRESIGVWSTKFSGS